jgi:hypothetical protein
MNNLVRGEIKHLTSQGGDMDSFEWVLTGTKLLFIPYISIYNKFQRMNVNMIMNICTLANNNLVIEPNDHA